MSDAGRIGIVSAAPDGTDVVWLDMLGIASALRYSFSYPGGAMNATWQMSLNPRYQHRALQQGRSIGLCCGGSTIWNGNLDNPVRGDVWQFTAIGDAAASKRLLAYAPTSGNALNLSEVLTNANTRGLGWTVVGSLPTMPTVSGKTATAQSGSMYIDEALDTVASGQTSPIYWYLDRYDRLTFAAPPATPGYILFATDTGGGRTMDDFASDVYTTYESAAGVLSTSVQSASSRPFGRFEVPLDETALGLIASSQADSFGSTYLAKNGARAKFTQPFTVTKGQLRTSTGTEMDLALAQPGILTSVIVTDPDTAGDVTPFTAAPTTVLGGQTDYDVDTDVLTFTPTDVAQDNLQALLAS